MLYSMILGSMSGKKKKHQLVHRNASGRVIKAKAKKKSIFGLKGVSHSIKKPKKLIIAPKNKVSTSIDCQI